MSDIINTRPNLFIVGAAKAGTSTLHNLLSQHPEVYMSSLKEPHYFSMASKESITRKKITTIADEKSYLELFSVKSANQKKIIGESSTSYLLDSNVPSAIQAFSPNSHIIILIRDPVTRAHSHYENNIREGFESRTFESAISEEMNGCLIGNKLYNASIYRYLEYGKYYDRIIRYKSLFDKKCHIYIYEDFFKDLTKSFKNICDDLEISNNFIPKINSINVAAEPRNFIVRYFSRFFILRQAYRYVIPSKIREVLRNKILFKPIIKKSILTTELQNRLTDYYKIDRNFLELELKKPMPWIK